MASSKGAQVIERLAPQAEDLVVAKPGPSSFQHTELDRILANLRVSALLLAGGGLPGSLSATTRQGAALGYEMAMVNDALYPRECRYLDSLKSRAVQLSTKEWIEVLTQSEPAAHSPSQGEDGSALLLVDMQNDFVHSVGAFHRFGYSRRPLSKSQRQRLIENNGKLVAAARGLGPTGHIHAPGLAPGPRRRCQSAGASEATARRRRISSA